jgi:hypothetical protein
VSRAYDIRRARRDRERERSFYGESLTEWKARAIAKPPTLSEIYARNHVNRERCPWSIDLEELLASNPRRRGKRS